MRILNFKTFENNNLDGNFPTLEEVKSYFYYFTDEVGTSISNYNVGYVYFESAKYSRIMQTKERPVEDFVDILNTELSNNQLAIINDFIYVNHEISPNKKNKLKYILSGEIPSYEYMNFLFRDPLFDKQHFEELVECCKSLYLETGFRPFGFCWTEDYVSAEGDDVITKLGFEGTFFRGSDDEYFKICKIFNQGDKTKDLVKHFI